MQKLNCPLPMSILIWILLLLVAPIPTIFITYRVFTMPVDADTELYSQVTQHQAGPLYLIEFFRYVITVLWLVS